MKLRVAVTCGGCALAVACLFPDLGELTPNDASTDTSTETGGSDATPEAEAGFDAGTCGDGSFFCDKLCTTPTFCEDFDHDQAFAAWQSQVTSQGGNVVYDPTISASPPRSAKFTTPGSSSSGQVYAGLERDFTAASRVVLELDLLVQQPSSSAETGIAQLTLHPQAPYDYASAWLDVQTNFSVGETIHLLDGGYSGNDTTFTDAAVPYGSWHHVRLDMDFAAKTAQFSLDGTLVSTTALANGFMPGSTSTLSIGQFYANGPTPAWNVHIDDVVVNVTP